MNLKKRRRIRAILSIVGAAMAIPLASASEAELPLDRHVRAYQLREVANACVEADFAPLLSASKIKGAFEGMENALLASGLNPDAVYQKAMKVELDSATAFLFMTIQTAQMLGQTSDRDRQVFERSCATAVAAAVNEAQALVGETGKRAEGAALTEANRKPKTDLGMLAGNQIGSGGSSPAKPGSLDDVASLEIDGKGISNGDGHYVLTPENAVVALDDFAVRTGTKRKKVVTERIWGVSGEAGAALVEHSLVREGEVWLVVEEHRLDPSTGDVAPKKGGAIRVITSRIVDRAGARSGSAIGMVNGFKIKKHCKYAEGMVYCVSPYSQNVDYVLGESDSIMTLGDLNDRRNKVNIAEIRISQEDDVNE